MKKIPDAAFTELKEIYVRLDAELQPLRRFCTSRGICCDFAKVGHMLYATGLEAAYMARSGVAPSAENSENGKCPYLNGSLCGIRDNRAIGCRLYYCDKTYEDNRNALYERHLKQVRDIEVKYGLDHTYDPVTQLNFEELVQA